MQVWIEDWAKRLSGWEECDVYAVTWKRRRRKMKGDLLNSHSFCTTTTTTTTTTTITATTTATTTSTAASAASAAHLPHVSQINPMKIKASGDLYNQQNGPNDKYFPKQTLLYPTKNQNYPPKPDTLHD
ncbi:hypothetical protein E2C01_068081 [Portunus trituberculatus]|uniref:Uncharacterized protein n=1 Tax=Portunus trituberculatus TaxID=210409 RepID=A0A5B7HZ50_PORTR|nr:hypothetical protein [Portunus trituberculatus]